MKECIMLGRGPSRVDCLSDKPVWTVSWGWDFAPRIDKLFTVHKWDEEELEEFKKWQAKGCEIVAPVPHPDLNVTIYPIEQVLKECGCKDFSDLICYMMAYAIYIEKVDKIWWYGIDCMGYTTYTMERGGMEFWAGVARGRGIEVINTFGSATLKPKDGMYGSWGNRTDRIARLLKADSVTAYKTPVFSGHGVMP